MPRPMHAFRPETVWLEGRQLLAARVAARSLPGAQVGFVGSPSAGALQVSQQSASATVTLQRTNPVRVLQVRVETVPSPAIGVNLAAVDQVVTFNPGQKQATLNIPINPGASNPGEVDVQLTLTPIDPPPNLKSTAPLELRIMATADAIPPTIVSGERTPQGIALTFSKPMDPAVVSQVQNYLVRGSTTKQTDAGSVLAAVFLGKWKGLSPTTYSGRVRLLAATYNPATLTVTLVPSRPLDPSAELNVTAGTLLKARLRPHGRTEAARTLTDEAGNPIAGNIGPGEFSVPIAPAHPSVG